MALLTSPCANAARSGAEAGSRTPLTGVCAAQAEKRGREADRENSLPPRLPHRLGPCNFL
jgi:hypothetical protein